MHKVLGRKFRCFVREAEGNVAILFGVALIPILLSVGVAVDYGRAMIVRDRMADAADAAALAIGSWPDLTPDQMKTKAQQFFDANYPPSTLGTVGKLDVSFSGEDINVSVSGSVKTTFMNLANVDHVDVGAKSTVTKKQRNIELVLVLDTTGSMGQGGKMAAMQSAAKKMVQTLFNGKSTSDSLKIAVVPFSAAVNIGTDKLNSGWLDKTAGSTISYEDFKAGVKVLDLYDQINNRNWAGCVRERGGQYELTDDAPTSANTRWAPYFAPDEPDSPSGYANNYLNDGSYSGATCYSGNSNADKRQCYTGKYNNATVNGTSKGPDYNCPPRAITPLTNNQGQVISAIEQLQPKGNTVIPAGLLWGWRVSSPTEPFTEGVAYDDEKWVKAIVLLTDGENNVSGGSNGHDESTYNAFGFARSGHLGNTSGSNAEATLDSKSTTVCNAIKVKNIILYTIGFQITDTTTQNLLKSCATKTDMFYNSPSNDQLAGIFQDIAQGLGDLRIAK